MKRPFQFAAAVVVLLLAVQTALAGMACAPSAMTQGTCPMGMSEMGADCPMAHGLAAECTQDCCNGSAPKAITLPATPAKLRLLAASFQVSLVIASHGLLMQPDGLTRAAATSSPPRYLLNRAFRI